MEKKSILEQFKLLSQNWNKMMKDMKEAQDIFAGKLYLELRQELRKTAQSENVNITGVVCDEKDMEESHMYKLEDNVFETVDSQYPFYTAQLIGDIIYTRDEQSCGYKRFHTWMGVRFEGSKPFKWTFVQQTFDGGGMINRSRLVELVE